MKKSLLMPFGILVLVLASSCGKNDDPAPTTVVQPVGTVTCPSGQVVYNNTCVNTVNGLPPGYTGSGYTSMPPGGYCSGAYWASGYSYNSYCSSGNYYGSYSVRWYYWNGFIYYW